MKRFHINPATGNPGPCNPVVTGICKYGEGAEHYDSVDEARAAYSQRPSFGRISLKAIARGVRRMRSLGHPVSKVNRRRMVAASLAFSAVASLGACSIDHIDDDPTPQDRYSAPADTGTKDHVQNDNVPDPRKYIPTQEEVDAAIDKAREMSQSPEAQELKDRLKDEAGGFLDGLQDSLEEVDTGTSSSENTAGADYDRDAFKHWTDTDLYNNTCDTRADILQRDMTDITFDEDGCVYSGTLADPYTGQTIYYIRGNDTVDIDHIVSLSDAWERGADQWTDAQREAFANDPDNLLAVDMHSNRSKGDQTPATWTPINREMACEYGLTFLEVSEKYDLKVQDADIESVQLSCGDAR